MAAKLSETRRYYTRYNTLTDTKKFLLKEISILDSVFQNYPAARSSESGKEKFCEQIDGIKGGVDKTLARCEGSRNEEKTKHHEMLEGYNKLSEKQRAYFKAVKQFQDECTENERLLALLEQKKSSRA